MKTVSMLEFRKDAEGVIRRARQGQRMILTYRGKSVIRLEPVDDEPVGKDDPFYSLDQLADSKGKRLSNQEMDKIIYEA